jgi:hypothetical protein
VFVDSLLEKMQPWQRQCINYMYDNLRHQMPYPGVYVPDLYVYVRTSVDVCATRIQRRARSEEAPTPEFLSLLNKTGDAHDAVLGDTDGWVIVTTNNRVVRLDVDEAYNPRSYFDSRASRDVERHCALYRALLVAAFRTGQRVYAFVPVIVIDNTTDSDADPERYVRDVLAPVHQAVSFLHAELKQYAV